MSAVRESLWDEWGRLKVLETAIEEGPWRVVHGRMDDWMQVPLEARSVHGQVFGCWGRDAAETTRTYEFVTQARNLLPELMAGVERLIWAADGVVAGADAVAQTELMAELVAALGALREVREVPVIPDAEVGVAEDLTDRTDRTDF